VISDAIADIGPMRAVIVAALLALAAPPAAAADSSPAEQISSFRLQHGEIRVARDATLDRIALEQARAMAARNTLDHDVLGKFGNRIAPSRAGRAAENIAYGYDSFDKTLQQWINSSEHRKNLLLHNATRVGIASARDDSGKRTYWAMEIAGDYEKALPKGRKEPVVAVVKRKPSAEKCHIKLLALCL
jgi:Cysteine-rich secretory protein family